MVFSFLKESQVTTFKSQTKSLPIQVIVKYLIDFSKFLLLKYVFVPCTIILQNRLVESICKHFPYFYCHAHGKSVTFLSPCFERSWMTFRDVTSSRMSLFSAAGAISL